MSILPHGFCLLDTQAARMHRLKKTVLTSARLIDAELQGAKFQSVFVTLTYRPDVDWSSEHVSNYLAAVRIWASRLGFTLRYVWVAELQKRGAVHYHLLLWIPRHLQLPKSDRRGWWKHGSSNTQIARMPVAYMCKYLSKGETKDVKFPAGIRIYGAGGLGKLSRAEVRWWNFPRWVRELYPLDQALAVKRASSGGGVQNLQTGEVIRSRYERVLFVRWDGRRQVLFREKGSPVPVPEWVRSAKSQSSIASNLFVSSDAAVALGVQYRVEQKYSDLLPAREISSDRRVAVRMARDEIQDSRSFAELSALAGWVSNDCLCPF